MKKSKVLLYVVFSICTITMMSCEDDLFGDRERMVETEDFGEGITNEMLEHINNIRANGCNCGDEFFPSVHLLTWDTRLEQSAFLHSKDMEENDYFSHQSQDGRDLEDRVNAQNYEWLAIGENIAQGHPTSEMVIEHWLTSPSHCRNIMSANFDDMGMARSGEYWTMDLGREAQ